METMIIIGLLIVIIIVSLLNNSKTKKKYTQVTNTKTVNQESYQRYAKFYEHAIPTDILFEDKMNKIYQTIMIDKTRDIKKIAAKSGCSYDECILKIRYLKKKTNW